MSKCQCPECRSPYEQTKITVKDGLGIAAAALIAMAAVVVFL